MTAADTFHFRSRGLLRPVETPGPVLRTPPRQPKLEVIMRRSDEDPQARIEIPGTDVTPEGVAEMRQRAKPHMAARSWRVIEDADAQLWDGWPSDASDAWIDAGKPAPRPVPRNPWPLIGLIIVVASAAVGGYALWRVAVEIW